jgi:hypothetical protein
MKEKVKTQVFRILVVIATLMAFVAIKTLFHMNW